MLALYIGGLILGGGLLLVSLLTGGDAEEVELGHGGEVDLAHGADVGAGEGAGGHGHGGVLPLTSLTFWTFFFAFFGLTGTVLSLTGLAGGALTAALAVGVGLVAGVGMGQAMRRLRRSRVDSAVGPEDLVGSLGRVTLPVGGGHVGKVCVELKGRSVEVLAHGDADELLGRGHQVLIHEVLQNGTVRVVSAEERAPVPRRLEDANGKEDATWS
jgi:membrane protein implicated in regulation of membrane protease activity